MSDFKRATREHHGHCSGKKSATYESWRGMLDRCRNPSNRRYHRYGGRGIKVCEAWARSFVTFLNDMGERPVGMTLDRIDLDGDYTPDNCKWSTPKQQQRNMHTNRMVTFRGETLCVSAWAERLGMPHNTLSYRLRNWDIEKAMTEPIDQEARRRRCKTG